MLVPLGTGMDAVEHVFFIITTTLSATKALVNVLAAGLVADTDGNGPNLI